MAGHRAEDRISSVRTRNRTVYARRVNGPADYVESEAERSLGLMSARRLGTPREVAELLQCGLSTAYRLIARGVIPSITIPTTGLVRVPMERFENLLRQWESEGRRRRGRKGRNAGGLEGVGSWNLVVTQEGMARTSRRGSRVKVGRLQGENEG